MAHVTWSPRAADELIDTFEFLGRRSEEYAAAFARDVRRLADSIPDQPLLGAVVPEYGLDDVRERQYQSHRLLYRLRGDDVEIIAFVSVSQRLPRTPPG